MDSLLLIVFVSLVVLVSCGPGDRYKGYVSQRWI